MLGLFLFVGIVGFLWHCPIFKPWFGWYRRNPQMFIALVCSLLLNSATVHAQEPTPAFSMGKARVAADWISTGAVVAQIAGETIHNLRGPDKKRALINEGIQIGLTEVVTQLAKHFVHRERPDGSDMKSFFSGHTALGFAAGGWNASVSIPLSVATGVLRMGAAKHHPSDVAVGAITGWVMRKYVHIPPPRE